MADELDESIRQNATGPAKASGDAGSVEQHKLAEIACKTERYVRDYIQLVE